MAVATTRLLTEAPALQQPAAAELWGKLLVALVQYVDGTGAAGVARGMGARENAGTALVGMCLLYHVCLLHDPCIQADAVVWAVGIRSKVHKGLSALLRWHGAESGRRGLEVQTSPLNAHVDDAACIDVVCRP